MPAVQKNYPHLHYFWLKKNNIYVSYCCSIIKIDGL